MKAKFLNKIRTRRFRILKIVFAVLLLFSLINILLYFIIEKRSFDQLDRKVQSLHNRIRELINFEPIWDISQYFNDTEVYETLRNSYIFTAAGFCIDAKVDKENICLHTFRVKNASELAEIRTPVTIVTPVNEKCRIYTEAINAREGTKGLVLVSISEMLTSLKNSPDIDKKLKESARIIKGMISFKNGELIAEDIQSKKIPAMVSYAVIDEKGYLKESVGGPPLWIEKSLIQAYLGKEAISETVEKAGKKYRLLSSIYKTHDRLLNS